MTSILLKNGYVLTMDASRAIFPRGFVFVDDAKVAAVGDARDAPHDREANAVIDASGCVIAPGLINMHQHHWYHLLKGMSEGLYLEDWVSEVLFPAGRELRPNDLVASMRLAVADMLLSGTTSFFNHSVTEVNEQVVDSLADVSLRGGIRQFFGKELRATPTASSSESHRAEVESLLSRYPHGLDSRFCVGLAIESGQHWLETGAMTAELAAYSASLVEKFSTPVSDHITGGTLFRSVSEFRREQGSGEVHWLARHGLLSERMLLAHAVWIDESEMRTAAQCGASIVTCPSSGAFTAGGTAPLRGFAEAGLNIALGSDGPMVNDSVDMLGQMRECFLLSSSRYLTPAAISTAQLWEMATRNAARALGLAGRLGELTPDAVADIAVFDISAVRYGGALNPPANLILCGGGPDVHTLLVDGQIVVERGRLLTMGVDEVIAECRDLARDLAARSGVEKRLAARQRNLSRR